MSKQLIIILLFIGAFYIFLNQEDVIDSVRAFFKLEGGGNRVQNTIMERQKSFDAMERRAWDK